MKLEIRENILERRSRLSKQETHIKSDTIKQKLFSLKDYKNSEVVCFFVSFGSEVNTHAMIKEAIENGKKVCVPVIQGDNIILSIISSFDDLDKKNNYGILEPSEINEIDKDNINLIIVPGIAFDKQGYRVGYGKGYYDKLLEKFKGKKIGLAFKLQIIDKIPIKKHDIKVDKIITE